MLYLSMKQEVLRRAGVERSVGSDDSKNKEGCNRKRGVCGGVEVQLSVGEGVHGRRHFPVCSTATSVIL